MWVAGYYTRSGYVPGPLCRYNWTEVYNLAMEKNKYLNPPVSCKAKHAKSFFVDNLYTFVW